MKISNPLVTEIRPALVRFACGRGISHEDSEDLVQDVLMRVWCRDPDFETERHVLGYLYTSVRYACVSLFRGRKMVLEELGELASPLSDPATQLQSKETELILRRFLQDEDPALRALIDPDSEMRSYADAAAIMDKSVGALRTSISRRRKVLRVKFEEALSA
ncbi:MAG: hypothetical protein GWQ05_09545 [Verrucomicrobiaceae bacterium]|nr:hypothetical protein [Verrucomicrobiaceae bacterium]